MIIEKSKFQVPWDHKHFQGVSTQQTPSLLLTVWPKRGQERWKWEEKQFIKIYFTTQSQSWKWPVECLALIGWGVSILASDWLLRLNGVRWHLSDTNSRDNQPWARGAGHNGPHTASNDQANKQHILHIHGELQNKYLGNEDPFLRS